MRGVVPLLVGHLQVTLILLLSEFASVNERQVYGGQAESLRPTWESRTQVLYDFV